MAATNKNVKIMHPTGPIPLGSPAKKTTDTIKPEIMPPPI
jgi:hypothetical protein